MPIYEYKCKRCGNLIEKLLSFNERVSGAPICCEEKMDMIFSTFHGKVLGPNIDYKYNGVVNPRP